LYTDLPQFVEYATARRLLCTVGTNGLKLEDFAHALVDANLTQLVVSVDGPPTVHNRIRGVNGAYEKACAGVADVLRRRSETASRFPRVTVNYAISSGNFDCLHRTARDLLDLGVDRVSFSHLNFIDASMANAHNEKYADIFGRVSPSSTAAVNPKDVNADVLFEEMCAVKEHYSDRIVFYPDVQDREGLREYYHTTRCASEITCTVPWTQVQILANGNVIPHSRCFNLVMGNINSQRLRDIWNGPALREFRRKLKTHGPTPACTRCCALNRADLVSKRCRLKGAHSNPNDQRCDEKESARPS